MQLMSTADMVSCLLVVPPDRPDEARRAILEFRDQAGPHDRELVLVVRLADPGPDGPERDRAARAFAPLTDLEGFLREHDPDGCAIYRYTFLALAEGDAAGPRTAADWLALAAGTAHGVRLLWWDPAVRHGPGWLIAQEEEDG